MGTTAFVNRANFGDPEEALISPMTGGGMEDQLPMASMFTDCADVIEFPNDQEML